MRTFLLCDEGVYEEIEFKLFLNFRNMISDDTVYFTFNNFKNPSGLNFNNFDGKKHTYPKLDNFNFDDSFFLQEINNSFKSIIASSGIDEFTLENFNDNILMLEMVFV